MKQIVDFLSYLLKNAEAGDININLEELRRLIEEANELYEFDIRVLGDSLYDGIYIADGEGKTLYVNKAYEKMTGINGEDIVNKKVSDLEGVYFKNSVSHEVIEKKTIVNSMGKSLINSNHMLVTGSPILTTEENTVSKVVVNNRDISDLIDMKEALERSMAELEHTKAKHSKTKSEIAYLREQSIQKSRLIAESCAMKAVMEQIRMVSNVDVNTLIFGETGVGKEVVASEIYENSPFKGKPFIKVNCSAIPKELFESEFFGYEKGAFTGAKQNGKIGLFELANNGMILLDEIGDTPLDMQSKLLRAIQSKEFLRVGGTKSIRFNARIVAATNQELAQMVRKGTFREDLFYRLNVFPIEIPPLRERTDDIPALTQHFIEKYAKHYNKSFAIDSSAIRMMTEYHWPGNIRELENIIERLFIVSKDGAVIGRRQISNALHISEEPECGEQKNFYKLIGNYEKQLLERAVKKFKTTREIADYLEIAQSTVVKKMKKWNISNP